jgi:hypothetical protein
MVRDRYLIQQQDSQLIKSPIDSDTLLLSDFKV